MRRLLPVLLGGALLSLTPAAALAQNMCSPSTLQTTRYPGYPGSAPYSGNTTQVTSNCTGAAVDAGITADPYADVVVQFGPDGRPIPPAPRAAGSEPSADPTALYAPTGPAGGPPAGAMAGPPQGPLQGPPGSYPGYAAAGQPSGSYPGYAAAGQPSGPSDGATTQPYPGASMPTGPGLPPGAMPMPPMGYPGQGMPPMGYPGQGMPPMGYPGQGMPPMNYPGQGMPMPGYGYPGQVSVGSGPGLPPGPPGWAPGSVPGY